MRADPTHVAAYELAEQTYEMSALLGAEFETRKSPPARFSRRALMAGGGLAAASLAAGAVFFLRSGGDAYATGIGEFEHVRLDNGVEVFLDADTKVIAHAQNNAQRLDLEYGQLEIALPENSSNEVEIRAGAWRVRAQSGSLNVRCSARNFTVFLNAGAAELLSPEGTFQLAAGQRMRATNGATPIFDRPNPDLVTAWRRRQLIFENQSLAEAVAELNRYSRTKLRVADERVGALRLSGMFNVGQNADFARSVALLLPVQPTIQQDEITLELASASSAAETP